MSLESKIDALTAAVLALTGAMQAAAIEVAGVPAAQPSYPPAQPQYQAPPVQQAPPAQQPAYQPPPVQQAPQGQYPFTDNVSAATWAKGVWNQAAAINQEAAMQKFAALMQGLGAVDFDHLTPDKFPGLFQGIQQIKAEMGIQG